jgi:MFS family permease
MIANTERNGLLPWVVCLSCALFFFYEFIQMNMINSLAPYLMRDFNVEAHQLGLLAATYFDANVLLLLPAGIILDRFSTKKVALLTISICIIGTIGFAAAPSIEWAAFFRLFTGVGSAFCFLSCMRLASVWFHEKRLALIVGATMTLAFLGGTVAQTPLTLVVNALGWREAIYLDAGLGVLIFIIMLFGIRDYPSQDVALRETARKKLQSIGFWKSLRRSYLNGQNWLCGIGANMMNLPVFILGAIWGGVFLVQAQHFSMTQATMITSMIYIGTLIGAPVTGYISDTIRRRKLPILIGAFFSLLLLLIIIYVPSMSLGAYMLLFLLLGFFSSSAIINYTFVAEKNSRVLTATSVSIVSFNVIGGGALFQPVVGLLLDQHWDGSKVNGVPMYSLANYHYAFILLPLGFVLAMILLAFTKETYAKPVD